MFVQLSTTEQFGDYAFQLKSPPLEIPTLTFYEESDRYRYVYQAVLSGSLYCISCTILRSEKNEDSMVKEMRSI